MTRTFLRIKRRRTEEPLPFIRLEGLNHRSGAPSLHDSASSKKRERDAGDGEVADLDSASLSDFLDSEQHHEARPHRSSSVLWKRLEPLQGESESCLIVDALLENWDKDGRQSKRRKLTLLETSKSSNLGKSSGVSLPTGKRKPIKVLDPCTRLVDDSLQEVHAGSRFISEHYRFLNTDRRLAVHDSKKWLSWCHASGGNLLHACALWNDTEMAGELLQIPNLAGPLCEALDGDGRTPYEVAQLSGHDSVCQVLEAFGGDTTNYVYDIFCLEEDLQNENTNDGKDEPTTVELTSGAAYWTPDGELMLEASEKAASYTDDCDGEIDSNCEDYDANDYPDEEEDVIWGHDERAYHHYHARNVTIDMANNRESCALDRQYLQRKPTPHLYADEGEDYDETLGVQGSYDTAPYTTTNDM